MHLMECLRFLGRGWFCVFVPGFVLGRVERFSSMESDSDSSTSTEISDGWYDGVRQYDPVQSSLIPGLPDDITFFCLARVPRKYHAVLKCVSKRWRDLVSSEEWYLYRKKHHLEETWIYALCKDELDHLGCYVLDPNRLLSGWKRIQGLPGCCKRRRGMGFEVLGKRVYLIGGCGYIEDATNEAYCYDAGTNCWSEAARLPVARCYFACQAVDNKIFAIGGSDPGSSNLQSLDAYDPQTNCWNSHVDPNVLDDIEDSVVLDGKIYVRCGSSAVSSHVYAVAYEPSSGTWEQAAPDMVMGWRGPAIVVNGTLYVLNQTSGTQLIMWQKDTRQWISVRRFSSKWTRPPCRLVAIGEDILIIGKGLSTMVFSTKNAGKMDGIMLSSSFRGLNSDLEVINCRSIAV
ncbi:F-box/kelch-repeat protein SKIP4-like isoform X2 [Coffea arabica]|uniref:F-box/kelch-repeat protein SKIP4-like isoform X2 n=1 Tax=Coffea arabica TaxID=13443 RepID=A0A6P6WNI4_COFAR|nr:F-box/kelch-repeat protein SKIP4-like isoform X1 [Coffea arabica]